MTSKAHIIGFFAVWIFVGLALAILLGGAMSYRKQPDPDVCLKDLIGQEKIGLAVVGSSLARFGLPEREDLAALAPADAAGDALRLTRSGPWPEEFLRVVRHALEARPDYLLIQIDPLIFQVAPPRPPAPLRAATRGLRDFTMDALIPFVHPVFCEPLDQDDPAAALERVFDGDVRFERGDYPILMHEEDYGAALRQIVDEEGASETKLYLFALPRSETAAAFMGEEVENRLQTAIARLSADSGLPLLRPMATLPDSHFFDQAHANREGRRIISRWLQDCLARLASSESAEAATPDDDLCGVARGG